MPEWLQALVLTWMAPTGIAAIIGFIIWLVQHNIIIVMMKSKQADHARMLKNNEKEHQQFLLTIERITTQLEHTANQLREAEEIISKHNAGAEKWYQRIVRLETLNGDKS
ncbi:MAG: hypothetical protein R3227_02860 [Reinekea sp.]|nr:hypothetical protein [Reinekea sp.]